MVVNMYEWVRTHVTDTTTERHVVVGHVNVVKAKARDKKKDELMKDYLFLLFGLS